MVNKAEFLKTDEPDQIFQMIVSPKITHICKLIFQCILFLRVHVGIVTLQIPSTLTLNLQPNKTLTQQFKKKKNSTISRGHLALLHLDTPSTHYAYVPAGVFYCLQRATPIISLEIHTNQMQKEEKGITT